jgi:hypothetical protein
MSIESIKESLALEMMRRGGFDPNNKQESPIEWDLSRPDSQYSTAKLIAAENVNFILNEIMQMQDEDEPELEEDFEDEETYKFGPLHREETNTTSACLFIFMDAGNGNPRYVRDVRQWLANVDKAGIPDDTEIDGQLYLDYDIKGVVETIECGECGNQDTLISNCGH